MAELAGSTDTAKLADDNLVADSNVLDLGLFEGKALALRRRKHRLSARYSDHRTRALRKRRPTKKSPR